MNIKKLIATVVFALGTTFAQAQSNFNFDMTMQSVNSSPYGPGAPSYVGDISFAATATLVGGNYILSNPTSIVFGLIDTVNSTPTSIVYSSTYAVSNLVGNLGTAGSGNFASIDASSAQSTPYGTLYAPNKVGFSFSANSSNFVISTDFSVASAGTQNGAPIYAGYRITTDSSGAPEIDGSLAPKVGFLLGCLFLMFGRKKQNTEPMMAA